MSWFQRNSNKIVNLAGIGIIVLLLLVYWVFFRMPEASKHILPQVSASDFDSVVLKADSPVFVDFYADWCPPCRRMEPILIEFAKENPQVKVVQVNVDQNAELSNRYDIQDIPTFLIFKKGELIARHSGMTEKGDLKALVNQ